LLWNTGDELVTLFDLLFLVVLLVSLTTLAIIIVTALLGRPRQAVKLLVIAGAGLASYLGLIVLVSLTSPQRELALKENRCFDDWCIAVDNSTRFESPTSLENVVTLRLSNQARRVSMRENGLVVYLMDDEGRRFESAADPSMAPFNILLQQGESITTTRTFVVPGTAKQLNLVIEHEGFGSFPGKFIIGDDSSLFHKPTIFRLPS